MEWKNPINFKILKKSESALLLDGISIEDWEF